MKYRTLRIAWSVVWGIAAVVLIALWLRSSIARGGITLMDRLTWHYDGPKAIQVGTVPGRVDIVAFVDRPVPSTVAAQADRQWESPWFQAMRLFGGKTQWWFDLRSKGTFHLVGIPDWLLVLSCGGLSALAWFSFRFSLRTLLIAMTLIVVGMGLIVWFSH
jgi:hypothetical protein